MKEKRGTCLSRNLTVLAEWAYSLMPYGVVLAMLFCRVVLGWQDLPFWRVWHPVFLAAMVGRYLVYLLRKVYGWKCGIGWRMVTLDAAAALASVVGIFYFEPAPWLWRGYILMSWIGAALLAVVLLQAVARDVAKWWRFGGGEIPSEDFCQSMRGTGPLDPTLRVMLESFCQCVRRLNAVQEVEDEDSDD